MITKEDYLSWREHPVTRVFMEAMIDEMNGAVENLVMFAGDNPLQDKYRRGTIDGLKWLVEWIPTVTEDDEDGITSSGAPDSD